jgi:dynein heavy chain 2
MADLSSSGMDGRQAQLAATVAAHFGITVDHKALHDLATDDVVREFLDDASCPGLVARYDHHHPDNAVSFSNVTSIDTAATESNAIVLFKIRPDVLSGESFKSNVFTSSLMASPVNSLYHTVKNVYAPMLLSNDQWSKTFHPHLQELLNELEKGLGKALRQSGVQDAADSLEGIITPADEFNFWADQVSLGGSQKLIERERSVFFEEEFGALRSDFADLTAPTLLELLELMERTQDVLDDVWKQTQFDPPYPLPRMQHLLGVMGTAIAGCIPKKLVDLDVWKGPYAEVRSSLRNASAVCKKWASNHPLLITAACILLR